MRPSDSNKILIVALRRKSLPTPDLSNYEYVGHGPPCSRTKIYAARVSRGGSSYRETYAARARPQQQTHRPPLLLSIDGTDRRTTDGRTLDRFMTLTACCVDLADPLTGREAVSEDCTLCYDFRQQRPQDFG